MTVAALVAQAEVKRALAMDSVSYNLGRALAPVLSVIVFMNVGFGLAFALNAVSFGFFTGVLLWLRPPQAGRAPTARGSWTVSASPTGIAESWSCCSWSPR